VGEDVGGVADICADIENVAGAEEFGIALREGPEGIFVVALVKKRSGEKGALNGTTSRMPDFGRGYRRREWSW